MTYNYNTSPGYLTSSISKALGKTLDNKLRKKGINIIAEEWFVISMLYHKKICTLNEIIEGIGLNKVKVTRITNNLLVRKVVNRSVSTADKRYRNVELTKTGTELYFKILPIAEKTIEKALIGFKASEKAMLIELLSRMNENLKNL